MTRPGPAEVRAALRRHARPQKAAGMQAYLKSELPCLGVAVPQARAVAKALFAAAPCEDEATLEGVVGRVWDEAAFREERFVAINVLRLKAHWPLVTVALAPFVERLIRSGAWWDLVDELSAHVVRQALENEPVAMAKVVRRWARSGALWLQRAGLVCQVVRGAETDLELLEFAIEHAVDGKDFFLRKGVGWALRAAAKHHPAQVQEWLERWDGRLSGLSVREAKKGLARG